MAGLADWEARSFGPSRSRIRRKRLDAVAYYRRRFGGLADDRLWTAVRLSRKVSLGRLSDRLHNPKREHQRGVLWHET